jgi:hypothetical protein
VEQAFGVPINVPASNRYLGGIFAMVTMTCSVALYAVFLLWRRVNRRYQHLSNTPEPWHKVMPSKSQTYFALQPLLQTNQGASGSTKSKSSELREIHCGFDAASDDSDSDGSSDESEDEGLTGHQYPRTNGPPPSEDLQTTHRHALGSCKSIFPNSRVAVGSGGHVLLSSSPGTAGEDDDYV